MDISPYSSIEVHRDEKRGIYIQIESKLDLHNVSNTFHQTTTYYRGIRSSSEQFFVPNLAEGLDWEKHFIEFLSNIIQKVKVLETAELTQVTRLASAKTLLEQFKVNMETD